MAYSAVLAAVGVALLVSAWSAHRSGKMALRYDLTYRDQKPRLFRVALIARVVLALAAFGLAVVVAVVPLDSK